MNTSPAAASGPHQIALKVREDVLQRVDDLAAYSGRDRSAWLRLAVAFADSTVTIDELDRLERQNGELDLEQRRTREHAQGMERAIRSAFRPRPVVSVS